LCGLGKLPEAGILELPETETTIPDNNTKDLDMSMTYTSPRTGAYKIIGNFPLAYTPVF
jgi:hypothetical protein